MYKILYAPPCHTDAKKLANSYLKEKCQALLKTIADSPFQDPPPYEKLCGDLAGCFSRRINIQHRLVYEVDEHAKLIKVLRMWTHYE
ncbi:Txe/YoeB family addiction module toxin [Candidatus Bealeia paramacronuclearis]|uniref:Putative mRNA interferase YoeB n=1 Tax=Candidatus Bealeia paramacronuclearis TaxID=1921001 RepID=A0ABZ2C1F1_9PROT|nr:Txe/YoeB family addiction module toxin [Candidatus Bealeia paramacronuclearis]